MSTDDNAWVTRKDAVALARCSEDAIKDTQKKHKLPPRTGTAGSTLLSLDDLGGPDRPGPRRGPDRGRDRRRVRRAGPHQGAVSQLRTEVGRQGGRLAEREAFLDLLHQQVAEKDHQIKALRATIERLVASLASRSAS
jgi:uncharacterized small protein (DUF1192 family)